MTSPSWPPSTAAWPSSTAALGMSNATSEHSTRKHGCFMRSFWFRVQPAVRSMRHAQTTAMKAGEQVAHAQTLTSSVSKQLEFARMAAIEMEGALPIGCHSNRLVLSVVATADGTALRYRD